MRKSLGALVLLSCAAAPFGRASAQVRLVGRVTDETKVGVPGAVVSLRLQKPAAPNQTGVARTHSGLSGVFEFVLPEAGRYYLEAEREGYFRLQKLPLDLFETDNEITIVLNHLRETHETIEVAYSPPAIDLEQTSAQQAVRGNDVLFVPYPSSHSFDNALRILPGAVVQDRSGEIHFNGGATNQTFWTLDGFNITDPLTGRFDSELSVEAARSVRLSSGRNSAEFGKGSAGALAIETGMGDDRFRYSATNFVPGIESRKGFAIGDWRPRLNVSGPIAKGRAWFYDSADIRYSKHIVEELPRGSDRTSSYGLSNLLRTQVNLTPGNILRVGLLANTFNAPRSGLSVFDPLEATVDRRSHQYFFNLKDQIYFSKGLIVEVGYARNQTFGREIPQGRGLYILTPQGRRGNFFVDAQRWSHRDQWLANAIFPSWSLAGSHQIKGGIDLNRLEYRQDVDRTGFERRRLDGTLRRRVLFSGDGSFRRSNSEAAWFVQDTWKVKPNLLLEVGFRQDWDGVVRDIATSPRFAFGWSPRNWEDTKISGGYAVVYDATSLQTFTRHLDQHTFTTLFDRNGIPEQGPLVTLFTLDRARRQLPRYQNWSLGVEQRLPADFYLKTEYLRRRGANGFTFVDVAPAEAPLISLGLAAVEGLGFEAVYGLRNDRRDTFDSFEATVRKNFQDKHVWLVSYTRSRNISNAALDINIDNPVIISNNFGPTPWDAPHRFLSWGYFPLTEKYGVAYMAEWRSGFPFSVESDDGRIIGAVNSRRFPDFFELNVHLERKVHLFGYRWALRAGFLNVTDRQNPSVVNNNIDAPDFLRFSGGTSRAFVTRIRWLGKNQGT